MDSSCEMNPVVANQILNKLRPDASGSSSYNGDSDTFEPYDPPGSYEGYETSVTSSSVYGGGKGKGKAKSWR